MHTQYTNRSNCHNVARRLPPSSLDDCQRDAQDDTEWQEFLALGQPLNPADAGAGTQWRNAPVLLSY